MFGPSETGIIHKNLKNKNKEKAIELYYEQYTEHHNALVTPNHKIIEMMHYLKEKDIKTAIVTGKAKRSLDISLKSLQMDKLFETVITGDDVHHPKPQPEGVIKALSLLEVRNHESMYVGGSNADIEAGRRANVATAGVNWLFDYQPDEFSIIPDYTFRNVLELKDFLEKSDLNEL